MPVQVLAIPLKRVQQLLLRQVFSGRDLIRSSGSIAHSYALVAQPTRSGLAPDAYWQGPHVRRPGSGNAVPHATAGKYTLW